MFRDRRRRGLGGVFSRRILGGWTVGSEWWTPQWWCFHPIRDAGFPSIIISWKISNPEPSDLDQVTVNIMISSSGLAYPTRVHCGAWIRTHVQNLYAEEKKSVCGRVRMRVRIEISFARTVTKSFSRHGLLPLSFCLPATGGE